MAAQQSESLRSFLNFSTNIKRTAVGVKFGERLFTNPDSISASQITQTLKALGLNLPNEVQVGADLAQVIVSGSAAVKAYKAGSEIGQIVNPGASSVALFSRLANQNGLMDDTTASQINVGTSVAMICASGGTNVLGWVSLATELGSSSVKAEMLANQLATQGLVDYYKARVSEESKNFTLALNQLQKGKVGIFGFLSLVATKGTFLYESAILKNPQLQGLKHIFPGLDFLPMTTVKIVSGAGVKTWYGDTKKKDIKISINGLGTDYLNLNKYEAQEFIFNNVVYPYIEGYMKLNLDFVSKGKANLYNTLKLLAFNQNMNFNDDLFSIMQNNLITPTDLGEYSLIKSLPNFTKKYEIVSSDGYEKISGGVDYSRNDEIDLDLKGNALNLYQDKDLVKQIRQKFDYQPTEYERSLNLKIKWRNANNFLAALDMLDLVFNDPLYKEFKAFDIKQVEQHLINIDFFKQELNRLTALSTLKKVNYLAKANIAYFLRTGPDKIKNISSLKEGEPARFVKG